MNNKTKVLTILALVALSACLITTAYAQVTDSSGNTYNLVKTSPTGSVSLGDNVVVTATTDNSLVNTVIFTWYAPDGSVAYTSTNNSPSISSGVKSFTSNSVIATQGNWKVSAEFENVKTLAGGGTRLKPIYDCTLSLTVQTSFFALPEYPLIGTLGVGIAMILALAVVRRKEISNQFKTDLAPS